MKKLHLLYVVSLSLLLFQTSCKKDDEPTPDPVVGEWNLDKITVTFPAPYNTQNQNRSAGGFGFEKYNYNIKADKTFTSEIRYLPAYGGQIEEVQGDWTFSNNTLELNYDDGDEEEYKLENNQLIDEYTNTFLLPQSATDTVGVEVQGTVKFIFLKGN